MLFGRILMKVARLKKFVLYEGVAWKVKARGGIEITPYCPSCHVPLSTGQMLKQFICPQCAFKPTFGFGELAHIWAKVPRAVATVVG
jgi:hypothetical protein